jgi:hypothetical protein
MVPETPPICVKTCWTGTQIESSLPQSQISSSHRNSTHSRPGSGVPLLSRGICLFNLDGNRLLVRKPSGHGLGFLQAPYTIADWQRRTGRKWKENLPPWIYELWHLILSRELGLPHKRPSWLKQPAVMTVPITTPQVLARLGVFKDDLRPFTVVTVPFPKRETVTDPLWNGYFIMRHTEKLNDLHGRTIGEYCQR